MPTPPTACVICDTPLSTLDAATSPTCGKRECRWSYQSTPAHERCEICARPLTREQFVGRVCATPECIRRAGIGRYREGERVRRASLTERALVIRAAAAASLGIDDVDAYPITLTPSIDRPLTPLPAERRAALHAHLEKIIAQAIERGPASVETRDPRDVAALEPPYPELGTVFAAACGNCRGSCCRNGGERAYLATETIQRRMLAHPELDAETTLAAYLAHVPESTIVDSCVYHGPMGCTLPREMRSDTCNRFYCGALHELERAVPEGHAVRAFVVAAEVDRLDAASFVDGSGRRIAHETR
jgi:hypothetical protein